MNFKKIIFAFIFCSSFCLGEPGGTGKFLGILTAYSSIGAAISGRKMKTLDALLVFSSCCPAILGQTTEFSISFLVFPGFHLILCVLFSKIFMELDDGRPIIFIVVLERCRDSSTAFSRLPDVPSLRFVPRSFLKILSVTCRCFMLLP